MSKIVPHLWFDTQAFEAAGFYASLFPNSTIVSRIPIHDTPSGEAEVVVAHLAGQEFQLWSAGPGFRFTPAISFLVACETAAGVGILWEKFSDGGQVLMPLDAYPFAERYAWVRDRYGLSWQVMYRKGAAVGQKITPTLMFVGDQCGRAEAAVKFYASVFGKSTVGEVTRYGPGEEPDKPGTVKHVAFALGDEGFAAMDSAHRHEFGFNEAISLLVHCDDQAEIDRLWKALSADPAAEACGWLKDEFGMSWQITPRIMLDWMREGPRLQQVTKAMLAMKKLDVAALKKAYQG